MNCGQPNTQTIRSMLFCRLSNWISTTYLSKSSKWYVNSFHYLSVRYMMSCCLAIPIMSYSMKTNLTHSISLWLSRFTHKIINFSDLGIYRTNTCVCAFIQDLNRNRNKSELDLMKQFENGSPSQRVLYVPLLPLLSTLENSGNCFHRMIFEEIYHFSKGSKMKLYFNGKGKFFLCRYQSYQPLIRLIVIILYIYWCSKVDLCLFSPIGIKCILGLGIFAPNVNVPFCTNVIDSTVHLANK